MIRRHLLATTLLLTACGSASSPPPQPVASLAVPAAPTSTIAQPVAEIAPEKPAAAQVRIDISIMSQCPYGIQAVNALYEMQRRLGNSVEIAVDYIGNPGENGTLCSMHGPNEVTGDIVQLCVKQAEPGRLLEFMHCQNRAPKEIDSNWAACLNELGIPTEPVRRCMGSDEGRRLLAASFERTRARGDTGSPTIRIAGEQYRGGRRVLDFARAACERMTSPHPYCSHMPVYPPVSVVVLTDSRCADCHPERYEGMLKARISRPEIRVVDFNSPEGKQLYEATQPGNLPVLVFDSTLDGDPDSLEQFQRGARVVGPYRVAPLGGEFNPMCQTAAQCGRAECKNVFACRKEAAGRLDIHIMSHCPYGIKAMNSLEQVFKDFPSLDLRVHYVGSGDARSGFTAMYGPSDVEEDKRELCAIAHYPSQRRYMKYIWCRNQDIRNPDWEACTGSATGIAAGVIRTCAEGPEGLKLLGESYKSSQEPGIGASPTWIVNNKFKHTGIDSWAISKFICEHNPKQPACARLPANPPPSPPAQPPAPISRCR